MLKEFFCITMFYAQTHPIKQKYAFCDSNTLIAMKCLFRVGPRCGWAWNCMWFVGRRCGWVLNYM